MVEKGTFYWIDLQLQTGDTRTFEAGRVPRVSRLMALAIRFDKLISDGVVTHQAELARLSGQPKIASQLACNQFSDRAVMASSTLSTTGM